jgi:hypothetical protein
VATYPAVAGLRKFLWGSAKPNFAAGLIEAWDCDRDAGVLRVVAVPGSAAPDRQIPLASLTVLSWQGVEETSFSGEYFHYDIGLFFDDGGRTGILHLPGSNAYLCASADQTREVVSRLRAFLKPVCLRLEGSALETMGKVLRNPTEGFKAVTAI